MKRRHVFGSGSRPVLSTPHGPALPHHGSAWHWVTDHKALVETLAVLSGALVIVLAFAWVQRTSVIVESTSSISALDAYRALHNYDAIEEARARRLINPRPVADRSYDAIEDLRAERLLLQGDRRYDAIEDLRAARLLTPLATPDRSYDAIEEIRATRDLGR